MITQETAMDGEEGTTKYAKGAKNGSQATVLKTKATSNVTTQADKLKENT
jgi:hypothetical protein